MRSIFKALKDAEGENRPVVLTPTMSATIVDLLQEVNGKMTSARSTVPSSTRNSTLCSPAANRTDNEPVVNHRNRQ